MAYKKKIDFRTAVFYRGLRDLRARGLDGDVVEQYLLEAERGPQGDPATPGANLGLQVVVYCEQGAFYRSKGRYAASLKAYGKARDLVVGSLGVDSAEHAAILNNMAGSCRLAGRPEEALGLYEEALEIFEAMGEADSFEMIGLHNNIALVSRETGQIRKAIRHLERAAQLLRERAGHARDAMVCCTNLTALYQHVGEPDKAAACLDEALAAAEALSDEEKARCAQTLGSLAGFLYSTGRYARAIDVYQKAAGYIEKADGKSEAYGAICQSMYWVYRRMGWIQAAVDALSEAQEVFARIYGAQSERTRSVEDELERAREACAG